MEAQVPNCQRCEKFFNQNEKIPLRLPCEESYCKECIVNGLRGEIFWCNTKECHEEHRIPRVDQLPVPKILL